jgi:hypothetical protein
MDMKIVAFPCLPIFPFLKSISFINREVHFRLGLTYKGMRIALLMVKYILLVFSSN